MSLRFSFSTSVALHFFFFLLFWALSTQTQLFKKTQIPKKEITYIEVVPSQNNIKNRVVQTSPGEIVKEAEKDAYLGEKTQKVEVQTVSKQMMTPDTATQSKPTAKTKKDTKIAEVPRAKEIESLSKFAVPILPTQQKPEADTPRFGEYKKSAAEYISGIKESDRTALNTKEFIFYGYYQRIRERLDKAWIPILKDKVQKLYSRGRQLASDFDYSTRVLVVMNTAGEITKVQVVSESGKKDLDEAAVNAFNQAGPFPNPPSGLVDASGNVVVPWEFIIRT